MNDEVLLHYSSKPLLRVESQEQELPLIRSSYDKPVGLWVSVQGDRDWEEWCRAESFGEDRLVLSHRIILSDAAKILRLKRAFELDDFTDEYGFEVGSSSWSRKGIDWKRLATIYQGIIIAPYQWSRRLETPVSSWY